MRLLLDMNLSPAWVPVLAAQPFRNRHQCIQRRVELN